MICSYDHSPLYKNSNGHCTEPVESYLTKCFYLRLSGLLRFITEEIVNAN